MKIAIAFVLMLSGYWVDAWSMMTQPSIETWQNIYPVVMDIQLVGFALFAFEVCQYRKTELKVAAFFMMIWRMFVFLLNILNGNPEWSPWFVLVMCGVYLLWLGKTAKMKELEEQAPIDGAYYFMMPVHSVWGLLKAIFMPWQHSRYESIVIAQGRKVWAVHKGYFVVRNIEDTDIFGKRGVRRYIGRDLEAGEIEQLDKLVGKRAFPGLRDCRRLRVV